MLKLEILKQNRLLWSKTFIAAGYAICILSTEVIHLIISENLDTFVISLFKHLTARRMIMIFLIYPSIRWNRIFRLFVKYLTTSFDNYDNFHYYPFSMKIKECSRGVFRFKKSFKLLWCKSNQVWYISLKLRVIGENPSYLVEEQNLGI